MASRATLLFCVLALLAVAPAAAQASGPADLYFHVADLANLADIPMNIVPPPEDFTFRAGPGPTSATFTCVANAQEAHTVYGIAYAAATQDHVLPQALSGQARGLAAQTEIVGNMTMQWFLEVSSQAAAGGADPDAVPLALANVVVRATMRQGEAVGGSSADYDAGALMAEGQSEPAFLAGPSTQGAGISMVDGHYVYNFTFPLTAQIRALTTDGFNVRVDVFFDNPACGTTGGAAMAPLVRIHNSPGHRPKLSLAVREPLKILATDVEESAAGIVHVRTSAQSVWGQYAVANLTVLAQGPSPVRNTTVVAVPSQAQDARSAPAYFFWNWNAKEERAVAGDYMLEVTVADHAGNLATRNATVQIAESEEHPPDPAKPAIGLGFSEAIALLGLAVVTTRRRR